MTGLRPPPPGAGPGAHKVISHIALQHTEGGLPTSPDYHYPCDKRNRHNVGFRGLPSVGTASCRILCRTLPEETATPGRSTLTQIGTPDQQLTNPLAQLAAHPHFTLTHYSRLGSDQGRSPCARSPT
jgi:hypothetical protein